MTRLDQECWICDVQENITAVGVGIAGAAVIGGVASGIGASKQADAATESAQIQADAAKHAADIQFDMFNSTAKRLQPFVDLGTEAINPLAQLTGTNPGGNPLTSPLTKPFTPQDLASTPGYQFTLDQGMQGVNNQLAASGLLKSGAAVKAGANYASGLASTTYNDQFKNYLAQQQQIYNMLTGLVQTGGNAGAQVGNYGTQAASQAGQLTAQAGAASAAGVVGSANAIAGGLNNFSNSLMTGALGYGMYKNGTLGA